jgi:hypothetical protein
MIFDDYWQDNVYSFNQKLVASKGIVESCDVREILMLRLPGCVNASQADTDMDRTGVDWLAALSSGRKVGVDVKIREKDCMKFGNDDVALETWSVVGSQVGWTRDESKVCEWVLWVWKDTGRFFLVPFLPLCSVFSKNWHEWRATYKPRTQKTTRNHRSWQSECVFVPRNVVVDAISDWYGGDLV